MAIVHEYFGPLGGSEAVALALHRLFPEAPVYTLFLDKRHLGDGVLHGADVRTSFLQRLPRIVTSYWLYFLLFPLAVRSLDLRGFDLVISSSHGWVKNLRAGPRALHICYCHTPLRYAWEGTEPGLPTDRWTRPLRWAFMKYLRRWDTQSTAGVHAFVANSQEVRQRIERCYSRSAQVVYPPIDTGFFVPQQHHGDYFLVVSRLVPYKRVDLAVQAFTRLALPLKVVGTGREMARLSRMAGPTVELLGWQPREHLRDLYAGCRALVVPGKEDLGMAALEAHSAGRPVIAYGEGGALETVIPGETGIHFTPQTVEGLIQALQQFGRSTWDPQHIRSHALNYDEGVFLSEMRRTVARNWESHVAMVSPVGPAVDRR